MLEVLEQGLAFVPGQKRTGFMGVSLTRECVERVIRGVFGVDFKVEIVGVDS